LCDLAALRQKESRLIIGLLSGTSADGIDAALVQVRGSGQQTEAQLLHFRSHPFPPGIREKIFELFRPETGTVDKICHLNFLLGELFAEAALALCREAGVSPEQIDLIASHGQTIYHRPDPVVEAGFSIRSTLQIGEAAVIAERTGVITISDFRTRDMAAGGQGAPLVPYVDFLLFRHEEKARALQNIGGIANVTYLPAGASLEEVLAFDTGPGNMIIDALVKTLGFGLTYDRDGAIAAAGRVREEILEELLGHPYYRRKPPKTTGREDFGEQYALSLLERYPGVAPEDWVATVTALTAESIARSYRDYLRPRGTIDEVIVAGGGSYNPTLLNRLAEALHRHLPTPPALHRLEDFGLSSEAKEAVAFAVLGNETLFGLPGNVPQATGAARRVVLGKVTPGC